MIPKCWLTNKHPLGWFFFILGLIQFFFVLSTTIFYAIIPEFGNSMIGKLQIFFISLCTLMALWCELATSFTNPGTPLTDLKLSESEMVDAIHNDRLVCFKCKSLRPIRAYHCDLCGCCILKQDHHCYWVNNCIGARNQKYFLLFVIYAIIGQLYSLIIGSIRLSKYYRYLFTMRNIAWIPLVRAFPGLSLIPSLVNQHYMYPIFNWKALPLLLLFVNILSCCFFLFFLFFQLIEQTCIRDCIINTMGESFCWNWFLPREGSLMNTILLSYSSECPNNLVNEYQTIHTIHDTNEYIPKKQYIIEEELKKMK
ncbi:hypothetical protein WA158_000648 [Blastocystis sp. Blastoise]